jgi:glutamate 5-kinase
MHGDRSSVSGARRWVVKIGSSVLTANGQGLDLEVIASLVSQVVALRNSGAEVVLVSSGAVAAGLVRLGWRERPASVAGLQAAAAVGQSSLARAWEAAFEQHDVIAAQILLSHADVRARDRYLNARAALGELLGKSVVPIINENDTVVTDEIRLGDNDTLGALVANLIDADVLVLLTDQNGLYDRHPGQHADARLIDWADVNDLALDSMAGEAGALGRGGMRTKLSAARLAARSGTTTVIACGTQNGVLPALGRGECLGTLLHTTRRPQSARKQWLASILHAQGSLVLDDGAVKGVTDDRKSLLPVGVTEVQGTFARGAMVRCVDTAGREVARGLVNYSDREASLLVGCSSREIADRLGYGGDPEMIHRDNLVMVS